MDLDGRKKAAIFLLSLPEDRALKILQHFNEEEIHDLRGVVEELGPVDNQVISDVYGEFTKAFRSGLTSMRGGEGYLRELVAKAHGEQEAIRLFAAPEEQEKPAEVVDERPFSALSGADPKLLGLTLSNEHPQVIAAVLAHLDGSLAAQIIEQMELERQCDIVRRITKLSNVPKSSFADAEQVLAGVDFTSGDGGEVDGVETAATILNALSGDSSDSLLEKLTEDFPDDATAVKRAMFTFENLIEADQRGLQQMLREVQSDTLLAALKTATEPLRDKIFGCMSSRAADMLREELMMMPPMRLAEVEEAQAQIVEIAMRLISEGKLSISGRGEGMV